VRLVRIAAFVISAAKQSSQDPNDARFSNEFQKHFYLLPPSPHRTQAWSLTQGNDGPSESSLESSGLLSSLCWLLWLFGPSADLSRRVHVLSPQTKKQQGLN